MIGKILLARTSNSIHALSARRRTSANAIPTPSLVQPELSPQINPPDFLVGRQAVWRAALENHPAMHDIGAIGDAQRLAHIVVRDEHADAAVLEVEDDLLNVAHRDRIDAGERLI